MGRQEVRETQDRYADTSKLAAWQRPWTLFPLRPGVAPLGGDKAMATATSRALTALSVRNRKRGEGLPGPTLIAHTRVMCVYVLDRAWPRRVC
eukprot:1699649-Prymnesium_polylepis.1